MLILPLHQPLTRANAPWATALLIALNVWVFLFLQLGDGAARLRANAYYLDSGLAAIETPLYREHLQQQGDAAPRVASDAERLYRQQWDRGFRDRLQQGELFANDDDRVAWRPLAAEFERRAGAVFSERHALQAEHPRLATLISSQFLHGGFGHLFGNMLFLAFIGLLVEAPLGALRFLLLYLLGGTAAGLTWALGQAGHSATLVGASGSIAALMGALCVLWGRRPIRFFYWFFVVFDYVRAPALWLLPLWLGWELLQLALFKGSQVAYAAHAGGILAGAGLALLARHLGWTREQAFAEILPVAKVDHDALLKQALEHLGHLRIREADTLLIELDHRQPGRFDIALARLRCARYGAVAEHLQPRLQALIALTAPNLAGLREQAKAAAELQALRDPIAPERALALAQRLAESGDSEAALTLAQSVDPHRIEAELLAQAWFRLALRMHEQGQAFLAGRLLRELQQRLPKSPQAGKAAFLLKEWQV